MDLIERQKAIDALANTKDLVDVTWTDENDNVIDSIEEKRNIIANWLEKVPPAQPDHRGSFAQGQEDDLVKDSGGLVKDLVNDCISRQAAITQWGK